MIDPAKKNRILSENGAIFLLGLFFFLFYCFGILFPDNWWGTHYSAFLPGWWKYAPISLSRIILSLTFVVNRLAVPLPTKKARHISGTIAIFSFTLTMGLFFHHFPIVDDNYGNAFALQPVLNEYVSELSYELVDYFFSLNFNPEETRNGVRYLVTFIAYASDVTIAEAFKWMDTICGSAFVGIWLIIVRLHFKENLFWQIIMSLTGMTAPFLQLFFGHIETYAPIFLIVLLWLIGLLFYFRTKRPLWLWSLLLLLVLGMKLHPFMLLFIPAWALAFLHNYFEKSPFSQQLLTLKGSLLCIFLPICLVGAFLYIFVFEDYNSPRLLQNFQDIDRLFLPLFSPPPPLDRYNLFSINHFFDYFNMMLLWSPPALFLLVLIGILYRKQIDWNTPELAIVGLTLLLFTTFLFAINPLFSMPMDWDLFSLPAPLLLVFVLILTRQVQQTSLASKVLPCCFALGILCLPVFAVNASVKPHSYRLESVGIRVFKTYYEHSAKYIHYALSLIENDPKLYLQRKQNVLDKLQPYAIPGNDIKYASLLTDNGYYYLRVAQDYEKAREYFLRAHSYSPQYGLNLQYLMEAHFQLKEFGRAHETATQLVAIEYPDRRTALRYGIHCALEAELFVEAEKHCKAYLGDFPDDEFISMVNEHLETKTNLHKLKLLFTRGK